MKPILLAAAGLASLAIAGPAALADAAPAASRAASLRPTINMAEARAIALRARPGRITDQELEKEGGGSGLRYSFDVSASGVTYEVGVDARSGKVLENRREGPHPD